MKKFLLLTFTLIIGFANAQQFDHSTWDAVLNKYVSTKGEVNYKAIKNDPTELNSYLDQLSSAKLNKTWSKEETLAFYIIASNAFTVKLIIDNYPTKSIKDIKQPGDKKFISIDGKTLSLNNIEHDI